VDTCFICGGKATTREHIVPKWLQNKHGLWNQRLQLPNHTTIKYGQVTIPLCATCNNEVLAPIEKRIQTQTASDTDIWKWALKIHYGLLHKHDFLEWDRRHPGYKMGQVLARDDPAELDRHLSHSISGAFQTDPSPFGSVFRFDFDSEMEFMLANLMKNPGICINTGRRGYVVFIKDTATLNRQPSMIELYRKMCIRTHVGKMLNFFANAWMHLDRHEFHITILMADNWIKLLDTPELVSVRPFDESLFQKLWDGFNAGRKTRIMNNEEYEATNGILS
jgi:hypothetical protein